MAITKHSGNSASSNYISRSTTWSCYSSATACSRAATTSLEHQNRTTKALSKKLVYFGGSSDPDKKFVTKMKINVTRRVGPDGVMTDIFEVVDKKKGNNVGREEQIALMLFTRGLVRGRRATAKSKVIPLEDDQKREALIQVRMEQRHRQRGDVVGEVGAPLLNE